MPFEHIYHQACQHINKPVEIECHDGMIHRGIVHSVERETVFIRRMGDVGGGAGFDGPGMFAWGYGGGGSFFGGFAGALTGVALGNIFAFRPYPYPYYY
ncbi:hypothetical protein [Tuberibacillus sp. Marseille-P3662]|uniref:hypothetical protein n=1 Tax=Tuberibacillus sp. Marseille-P3662 TaxID=1965358 RepID=UPI000A1CBA88|nr:hypothetical protein [Tuberibacillus sp. Marseille-P3662]